MASRIPVAADVMCYAISRSTEQECLHRISHYLGLSSETLALMSSASARAATARSKDRRKATPSTTRAPFSVDYIEFRRNFVETRIPA